jgi:acyl-CoA synthetase (NDP forming)
LKVDFEKLDRAFNPQCLVVVGDKPTGMWINNLKKNGFKGKLYSVNIDPEVAAGIEAIGVKNYTSILDVPEQVDLVIVTVPRVAALRVLDDIIKKDVGAVHFFTAGFSETGTEEGRKMEQALVEKARAANLNLIGPNCMGIYNPRLGVGQNVWPYTGFSAPIALISQSGTHATNFGEHTWMQAMDLNKGVSFGNGQVLDAPDYLEYFDQNTEIKVIGMYMEGVRNGRRFIEVLKKVAAHKPVVVWKGGRTEEGERAISSHTASLAVSMKVWEAAVRQCGAVNAATIEELIDTMKALLFFPKVSGNRVGIAGGSGGPSVDIADTFAEAGLKVPRLTESSYTELATFFSLIGGGYRNPVDTGNANRREMKRIMDVLARDENIDNLALLTGARWGNTRQPEADYTLLEELKNTTTKPVMAILPYITSEEMKLSSEAARQFQAKGVAAFSSASRAARAIKNAADYYSSKSAR